MAESGTPMPEDARIKRRRQVWLWLALGIIGVGIAIGLVRPRFQRTSNHWPYDRCKQNLRDISLACQLYADDHEGRMPVTLESLFPDYAGDRRILNCPAAKSPAASGYALVPGLHSDMPGDFILLYEISIENHGRHWQGPDGHSGPWRRLVLLGGTVESWWSDQGEAEFQRRLAEQAEKVRNWKPPAATAGEAK